jgi:hypothetical protein
LLEFVAGGYRMVSDRNNGVRKKGDEKMTAATPQISESATMNFLLE